MDIFLDKIAFLEDDAAAARDVARLLARLVEGGVAELVKRLRSTGDARAAKLLAALAADGDLAAEIALCGGVRALVAALEGDLSTAALQAAVDALHRLAAYDLPAGAVEALLKCLARAPGDEACFKILRALNAIMRQRSVDAVSRIPKATEIVCRVVADRAKHGGVASEGCFYVSMVCDDDAEALGSTCEGAVRAVRRALKAHPIDQVVQRRGLDALAGLARLKPALVAKKGGALLAVDAIVNFSGDARIVAQALTVLALVAAEDAYSVRDACPGADWLATLAPAAADHADVRAVRRAFAGVASRVATDADVRGVLKDLQDIAAVVTTGRDKAGLERLARTAAAAAALGFCKEARRTLKEAAPSTVHVLTAVAGDARVDASTVRHLVTALAAMEDDGFAQDVLYDDALRAAVGVASSRCASPKTAATALDFVTRLALRSADDALAAGAARPPRRSSRAGAARRRRVRAGGRRVPVPGGALRHVGIDGERRGAQRRQALRGGADARDGLPDASTGRPRLYTEALRVLGRLGRTELRGRASALDAVFAAMDVVEDAAFQAQARRTASKLATDALARKAMQKLASVDAIKKLGRVLECRTDAPWAAEAVDVLTKTLRRALHEEDHAKARACVVALHRSRKHATEDYAGMFLDELRRHPTRDLIRDTATLVSNEAFRAALISNDGINVLLPLARDAALADAAERCLAVVAAHPRGAADLLKGGAARHACARLAEDPTSGGASLLLGALAPHASAEQLRKAGAARAVRAGLLDEDDDARERACGLVKEMTQLRSDLLASAPRLVKLLGNDEESPRAAARAVDALCAGDDAVQLFVDLDTAHKMMGAMRRWPDDDELARTCAGVLARLSGGDGSGLSEVLASAATQCGRLPEALDDLVADLTLAGHLVLLPGAVDDAGPVLDVVALVLERTTDANALDAAMTLLARLLQLRDIPVDAAAAARSIKGAFPRAVARAAAAAVALGRRGAGGIRELHRQGVTEGLKRDARVGAATLSYLLDAAAADAGALADETGAEAFAELLDAVPGRAGALAKAADTCAQALLEALPLLQDAAGQVVDALVTHAVAAPQAQAVPCRVEHVAALCRAREKLGKDDALSLHQATLATADGGKLCFGGYVPAFNDFVKGDLRGASSMRARNACEMVARGAGHGDADVNQALIEGRFPHALLDALKMPERLNDEAFAQNALYALRCLLEGGQTVDVAFDAARVVRAVAAAHPQNSYIGETARAVSTLIEEAQAGGPGARVAARLAALKAIHAAAADWTCALSDEGGDPYYYNGATKQSAWAQPAEHAALVAELDDLGDLMELCAGQVDPANCGALAACLSTHARDAVVSSRLAKVLEAVGRDDAVADLLCDVCGLEHLILGLEKASAPDHVLHVVALLDRVASLEKMRARLGTKQYITILNQVCLDHMGRGPIVEHVISIFGKLCTEEGAVAIQMEANVPYTLKWALQTHSAAKRLCEKCVLNASRLVAGNDDARTGYVCEQVTPELVASLETHNGDADFVVAVLKCFGAFSLHDPSILAMVSHGVTEKVVSATERHGDHAQLLRTAVELFGNLGAAEDDDLDARCTALLLEGGAVDAIGSILDSCRARIDGDALALIGACFDALYNLANDTNAAAAVVEGGLCEACVHCARVYDACDALVVQGVKLIGVLTYDSNAVQRLSRCGAAAVLADALRSRADDRDFVYDAILGLANLVTLDENAAAFRHDAKRLDALGDVLEAPRRRRGHRDVRA